MATASLVYDSKRECFYIFLDGVKMSEIHSIYDAFNYFDLAMHDADMKHFLSKETST